VKQYLVKANRLTKLGGAAVNGMRRLPKPEYRQREISDQLRVNSWALSKLNRYPKSKTTPARKFVSPEDLWDGPGGSEGEPAAETRIWPTGDFGFNKGELLGPK